MATQPQSTAHTTINKYRKEGGSVGEPPSRMSNTQLSTTPLRTDGRVLKDKVLQKKAVEPTGSELMVLPTPAEF